MLKAVREKSRHYTHMLYCRFVSEINKRTTCYFRVFNLHWLVYWKLPLLKWLTCSQHTLHWLCNSRAISMESSLPSIQCVFRNQVIAHLSKYTTKTFLFDHIDMFTSAFLATQISTMESPSRKMNALNWSQSSIVIIFSRRLYKIVPDYYTGFCCFFTKLIFFVFFFVITPYIYHKFSAKAYTKS